MQLFLRLEIGDGDRHPSLEQMSDRAQTSTESSESHDHRGFSCFLAIHPTSLAGARIVVHHLQPLATLFRMEPDLPTSPPPRVDPLAYVAIACACVFCCPFASLTGFIAGFVSWRRIKSSDGRLRGRNLAGAAMVLGLVMFPAQYFVSSSIESSQAALRKQGFQKTFEILFDTTADGRGLALEGVLTAHDGRRPSIEEVDRFADELQREFGRFRTVTVLNSAPLGSGIVGLTHQECAIYCSFESGTTTGAARCSVIGTGWSTPYNVRIATLQLTLPSGELRELVPGESVPADTMSAPTEGEGK